MNLTAPPTMRFGAPLAPLAIEETALAREFTPRAMMFWDDAPAKPYRMEGEVAVVEVIGALDTRGGWWWDGYDLVAQRVGAALADPKVKALVLSLDSPGGMAAGNLDCAQQLRSLADAAGKPFVAHAGTMACSAAYALACAADRVLLTSDGAVGSIGTLATVYDRTKATEKEGYDVRVVRSGALKADPHPDVPLTDASVARVRARINELAGHFAAWVSARRPQCAEPLSLQGAVIYGADAVTRGLADAVGTLADAVTTAASMAASTATKRKTTMNEKQALEAIVAMRGSLEVKTDEEVAAAVATLKTQAAQVPALTQQLAEARAEIKRRDDEAGIKARAEVLAKHKARGALTPAMEADEAYMSSLAGLTPAQLDANLARLSGVPTTESKAMPAGTVAKASAGTVGTRGAISVDEQKIARQMGVSDEDYVAARDGKKEQSR
ncbi:MAG: S49 family peptidase [Sandaracinaceae bacterium]